MQAYYMSVLAILQEKNERGIEFFLTMLNRSSIKVIMEETLERKVSP
jgi:hypothetical protein